MKKNLLLILSSIFALSGCEFDITLFRLFGKSDSEPNNSQNSQNSQENPKENEKQKQETDNTNTNNKDEQPGTSKEYTATIKLNGSEMCSVLGINNTGHQFDSTNTNSENVISLLNYLNSQLEDKTLFSSLQCVKMNTAAYESSYCLSLGTGYYLGDSGFNPGMFTLASKSNISKVEVKALAYFKQGWTADMISHIQINGEDHSLELAENQTPTLQTFTKEFNDENKTIELTSTGSRVLLDSIKVTWRI